MSSDYRYSIHNGKTSATITQLILSYSGLVTISVHDLNGRELQKVFQGEQTAGRHRLVVDGAELPTGVYSLQLRYNDKSACQKIILLK